MASTSTIVVWGDDVQARRLLRGQKPFAVYWVRGDMISGSNWFNDPRVLDHVLNGVDPVTYLKAKYASEPNAKIEWAARDAGQYNPRFYQGGYFMSVRRWLGVTATPEYETALSSSQQIDILTGDLIDICRVAAPDANTHKVYGSEIRNLLILACTEVETQLKGILRANGVTRRDLNMRDDYWKLAAPMKLDFYAVRLTHFRGYPETSPFKGWSSTNRLPWYGAYNNAKHDRELNFTEATLEHLISAVAALHVLMFAQYGPDVASQGRFMVISQSPEWNPPQYNHAHQLHPYQWTLVMHDFLKVPP